MNTHSRRKQLILRTLSYAITTISVLVLSAVLILLLEGYRFNKDKGVIQQGGLVQFISQPDGASVTVGKEPLANRTRSKITLYPGDYPVKMELAGYQPWQKKIHVKAGSVLWLNSALFVPLKPSTATVQEFSHISSTSTRPGGKYFTILQDAAIPKVANIKIDSDKPEIREIELPVSHYQAATAHEFKLGEWCDDDRHLLLHHTYDTKTEWIVVDVEQPDKSFQIGSLPDSDPRSVMCMVSDDSVITVYTDGSVWRYGTDGKASKLPLENIAEVQVWNTTLFYTTTPTEGKASTGYLSLGSDKARTFASYDVAADSGVHTAAANYFNRWYAATSRGKTVKIVKYTDFPSSGSDSSIAYTAVKEISVPEVVQSLDFKNDGRFVIFRHGNSQTTYDLELDKIYTVLIAGNPAHISTPLQWFDAFHFWSDANGSIRQYEFDGENQADIVKVTPGFNAVYAQNYKYLYSIGSNTTSGVALQRTEMTIKK